MTSSRWTHTAAMINLCRPISCAFTALASGAGWARAGDIGRTQSTATTALSIIAAVCACSGTMAFNDYWDADNDRRKGKIFASKNTQLVQHTSLLLAAACACCAIGIALQDVALAAFHLSLIALGYAYSLAHRLLLINNALVGLCAASVYLAGPIYHRMMNLDIALAWIFMFCNIITSEVLKDVRDAPSDGGYKSTLFPVISPTAFTWFVRTAALTCAALAYIWSPLALLSTLPLLTPFVIRCSTAHGAIVTERAFDCSLALFLCCLLSMPHCQ